jgi:hypothetical protein
MARRSPTSFPGFYESGLKDTIREMMPELKANLRDKTSLQNTHKSEETKTPKEFKKIEATKETKEPISPKDTPSQAGDTISEEERTMEKFYNIIALYDLKGALPKPLASLVGKELADWIVENMKHDLDVRKLGIMVQEATDKMNNRRFIKHLIFWASFVGGVGGYVLLECVLEEATNTEWQLKNEIQEKENENEELAKELQSKDLIIEAYAKELIEKGQEIETLQTRLNVQQ